MSLPFVIGERRVLKKLGGKMTVMSRSDFGDDIFGGTARVSGEGSEMDFLDEIWAQSDRQTGGNLLSRIIAPYWVMVTSGGDTVSAGER